MSSGGATWGAELRMRVYRALERHLSAGVRTGHRSLQDQAPGRGLDVGHSKTEHRGEDWTRVTPRLSAVVRTERRSLQDQAPGRGLDVGHSKTEHRGEDRTQVTPRPSAGARTGRESLQERPSQVLLDGCQEGQNEAGSTARCLGLSRREQRTTPGALPSLRECTGARLLAFG